MYVIIVYDVFQKRVNKLCKFLRKYLNWIQNSVFEGEINESSFEKMKIGIKKIIKEDDSIIIFKTENKKWLGREVIGKEKSEINHII